jgi:5-methylcytosine-specific restriction endonuclease McrA
LAEKYPDSKKPVEKVKPVAKNQNLIQCYVDDETLAQIEDLKARYSHQMPSGKMSDLLKILVRNAHRQPKPRKRVTIKTRSRHIPAEVKREMEKTRHLGCDHVDPETGERCGSKHFLQMDHIHEYSQGGLNEFHNLQWLCGFHNRHRFETSRGAPRFETTITADESRPQSHADSPG